LQTGNKYKETGRRNPARFNSGGDCVICATSGPAIEMGGEWLKASAYQERKAQSGFGIVRAKK
jgi:hypothetical protein